MTRDLLQALRTVDLIGPAASVVPCEIHKTHTPAPTYSELHHIIPQAWQVHWQPPQPWPLAAPSPDRPGVTLWDARTVALCRTGHGNVHYWLVAIMRELDALEHTGLDPDNPPTWAKAIAKIRIQARADRRHLVQADLGFASNALTRYEQAGGKLSDLIANRLWGQI